MTHPLLGAVIGSPVSHSLSPHLYRAAFQEMKIAGEYGAVECTVNDLPVVFRDLVSSGVRALSVTMPLKEAILDVVQTIDNDASLLRAVNCVSFNNGVSVGHNTDGDGCCDALVEQGGAVLVGAQVVVMGAGGTARSVALALGRHGAHVVVVNRTSAHGESLVESLSTAVVSAGGSLRVGAPEDVVASSVLVNATSVGMNSNESPVPADVLHAGLVVLDAVYQPMTTTLLAAARDIGGNNGGWIMDVDSASSPSMRSSIRLETIGCGPS